MNQTPTPASFQKSTTDAVSKAHHQQEQAQCGEIGRISNCANGEQVSKYSDPNGTVFIDRESHDGAWATFLNDVYHGN